ncbi:Multidrug resistance protein CDR1 [Spathaspora sp. JA1]|nr:Multidrug resistance protein CDR1 [Spathaspora sp. JA1]
MSDPEKRSISSNDPDASSDLLEYHGFDTNTSKAIQELARTLTNESTGSAYSNAGDIETAHGLQKYLTHMSQVPGINPYSDEPEVAKLDPNSEDFNAKFWVKNLRKLYESEPDYYKHSTLGLAYRDLRASGVANDSDYQPTVTNAIWKLLVEGFRSVRPVDESRYFDILKPMDAIMRPGEVTVVLGRPGAGCSTLLKTIAASTYGFKVDKNSRISYDGLTPHDIERNFRGDVIYSAETDVHFPHLSVGHTLEFAARMRTPQNRGIDVDRETYAKHMASVYMATYGLSHTRHTNVGNDFVRGVSGGERKRVSIAEVSLSGAKIQCWDNATRGLDAATALEFIRALKTSATVLEATPLIAIYQCSQDAYDLFDNVVVLYEGHQIFFGKADKAKDYFVRMGWHCPQRQTTADFLTSLTNPAEREPIYGYENKVPKSPLEFETFWKKSPEYAQLVQDIDQYILDAETRNAKQQYQDSHVARQSKHTNPRASYTISFPMQVKYIVARNFLRMKGDPSIPLGSIIGQLIMALVLSSVFYNLDQTTASFYYRGASMFFAVLYNAFSCILEIMSLFEARPIVEKHRKYALYRPSADAFAGIISELPVKFCISVAFNLVFYFMVNYRRNPGRFFFYWLINIWATLTMSHLFRSLGAVFTTIAGAMTPAAVFLIAMVVYTGFVIPEPSMLGWSKWIRYINPVSYAFESLMVNEFHDREFTCATFVPTGPGFENIADANRVCSTVGAVPGNNIVNGTNYLRLAYAYENANKWRNLGILIAFAVGFLVIYICLTEFNKGAMQKGEIVLFLKSSLKNHRRKNVSKTADAETGKLEKISYGDISEAAKKGDTTSENTDDNELPSNQETFLWRDLTYQVKIKKEDRVILDHVDGWVKPGQITALMGASGAGKTTLLNCLSERLTVGVITDGVRMVNGHSLDSSFQRSIGYVQQQDLHLAASTVREALRFSASLRQSNSIPSHEKDRYVDYIIDLLEMSDYADALVGVAGSGLNVEQRKRLTIGVELVAKPKLLLFLDEPTSGLDSQTAWSICKLMRKLADHGQAILCTIHQPSALLMKEFDRLLFLQSGGRTVYFGDLGKNCSTLIEYFEKYGADPCPKDANPAEWMLHVVGAAPGSHAKQDYFQVWRNSEEFANVQQELDIMERELVKIPRIDDPEDHLRYAAPIWKQYLIVTHRVIVHHWRSPGYIYAKAFLAVSTALFSGFSFFKADNSLQGLQNQMFAIFLYFMPFNTLLQQMLPYFVKHRDVYEVREAPSRTFSWFTFITSQITAEIPYMVIVGTLSFFCWYYPVGLYANAIPTHSVHSRGVLMWLLLSSFYVWTSTMGQLVMALMELPDNAANIAVLLFTMCLNFCGVLAGPDTLPRFWIFMYRCNPMTFIIQAILSTGLANTSVTCASQELLTINPPSGESCESFLDPYIQFAGGYVQTNSQGQCQFCQMDSTNQFLKSVNAVFSERWRNWGIFLAFIAINIILTVFFFWLVRVPKRSLFDVVYKLDPKSTTSKNMSDPEKRISSQDKDASLDSLEYHGFDSNTSKAIQELARTLTNESTGSGYSNASDVETAHGLQKYLTHMSEVPGINPYSDEPEVAKLDPNSEDFNAKFWVKNLRKLYESEPDYYKHSTLGLAYRDLRASGVANDSDYQPTVTNAIWKLLVEGFRYVRPHDESRYFDILKPMDAIMRPGEVTVVLGRPGAGCSTLLKTIAASTYGFNVDKNSKISYDGLSSRDIERNFRGDVIYSAETDVHFPHLSVGDTLEFAARMRTPQNRGIDVDRETYAKHMASVYMATYGLSHTRNTNVGNDFVQGVSGGERKRVSIAEVSLSGAKIQCWDNATRGLDAATALEFIRALKTSATVLEATPLIAIYQCSQDAYDLFDNVAVLYEGHQIFFGRADKAKDYFVRMGWHCPQRQTTADFLTSITNPAEREPIYGYENKVPKSPLEFETFWKQSPEYAQLIQDIDQYIHDVETRNAKQQYRESHIARQSKHTSPKSSYTVSFPMQVKYIVARNFLRMKGDPSIPVGSIIGQFIMALVLSSVFFNLDQTTASFYYRGASMFFAVLYNAFSCILEIMSLYEARPIVEKHKKYALYHPSADAFAGIISELPVKFFTSVTFNLVFYFMVNYRRTPGRFFFYWLINIWTTLTMSHLFRSLGAIFTTIAASLTPAAVLLLAMVIYTGFVIPEPSMLGWSKWIRYINPVSYAFESLMVNEFHDREFECATFVPTGPGFENIPDANRVCSTVGAEPGNHIVNGTNYLRLAYAYDNANKWRNLGILIAFTVGLLVVYIMLTEYNKGAMQKGEIVLFLKSSLKKHRRKNIDTETGKLEKIGYGDINEATKSEDNTSETSEDHELPSNQETFLWRDLTYQIRIKKEDRVILDHVDGWVKPGQITALMGASGAGKTTLLNCLSERLTVGVITDGVRMVNGHSLDSSFQRSIGYVQQQDLHLSGSTVREALRFSASLRQSNSIPSHEKDRYVDYIIDLLEMSDYADALVGVAGSGLNVEQRKRLTIGVELVAKPKLLLFLDEPTSGLDSQTAWSICKLMRKLADHGQAILCTIHQPSALLMKEFDRLLFLQSGGQTVYFGDLGKHCSTLIKYFEKYGADPCPRDANPAEWMLHVVGAAPGSHAKQDYFQVWRNSEEFRDVQQELDTMERELVKIPRIDDPEDHLRYAAPIWKQYLIVTHRVIVHHWRSPGYIYSKALLAIASSLFSGFSFFKADNSLQGLQNQMFAIFLYFMPFNTLIEQMLPYFVKHRDVYEVRESPSRTFSWFTFITSQITAEVPYMIVVGTLSFFSWYYPVGLYSNAIPTNSVHSRGALMWLLLTSYYVYTSTMGQLVMSFMQLPDNAANVAVILFTMCLNFCGVLAGPDTLPGFWIFMYRFNPMTYIIQAILSTGLANASVTCASQELLTINPPNGESCESFLDPYIQFAGGYVQTGSQGHCEFCPMNSTNQFLVSVNSIFSERWRNWGIFLAFIAFNIILTVFLFWLARVPKRSRERKHKKD